MTHCDVWLKQATRKFKQVELRDPENERFLWMAGIHYSNGQRYASDGYRAHILTHCEKQAGDGDHAVDWDDFGRIAPEDAGTIAVCTVLHVVKACENALAFVGAEKNRTMRVSLNGALELLAANDEYGQFSARLEAGAPYQTWKGNYPHVNPFVYYHRGEDVSFDIDAGFLKAALSIYPPLSTVKMMLRSVQNAIFIQPFEWPNEQAPQAIIMPQRNK